MPLTLQQYIYLFILNIPLFPRCSDIMLFSKYMHGGPLLSLFHFFSFDLYIYRFLNSYNLPSNWSLKLQLFVVAREE